MILSRILLVVIMNMKDIKTIIYENNDQTLIINIDDKNKILYKDITKIVNDELIFKYLISLFSIIANWKDEYINTQTIDGNNWKLCMIFKNNTKKEYKGHAVYPINFEAFEEITQKLIYEV